MRTAGVFHLLEASLSEQKQRQVSFVAACIAEALVIGLLPALFPSLPNRAPHHTDQYVALAFSSAAEQKLISKPRTLPKVFPKSITLPVLPKPHAEPPRVSEPHLQAESPAPISIYQPPLNTPAVPQGRPLPVATPALVHTGVFDQPAGNSGARMAAAREVQTGGFGNPEGIKGQAATGNPANVPKFGVFESAEGPGHGNGTDGSHGNAQTVADAGFGGISAETVIATDESDNSHRVVGAGFGSGGMDVGAHRGSEGRGNSTVKTGAFSAPETAQAPASRPGTVASEIRPVEILSKPSPQYTAEARRLGVQGEVVLSVIFQADGTLKVLGVVRSLGHGLDQMAEQAASQIRFKPAEQGGRPTNFAAILHIEFRLA
jgi:TonB family protein